MRERFPDEGTRRHPEALHHLEPIERWADRFEVLLLREGRDPLLELALQRCEPACAIGVAGRDVRARELVEPVEERPGITDVASNRRVGPSLPVPVEAEWELD